MEPKSKALISSEHSDEKPMNFEDDPPLQRKETLNMLGGISKLVLKSVLESTAQKFDYDTV